MQSPSIVERQRHNLVIAALCIFIACLSFKPSEPYLSEYLICNYDTAVESCSRIGSQGSCVGSCLWSGASCGLLPCSNVSVSSCGSSAEFNYCDVDSGNACVDRACYKSFSEEQVNDEIYTWSTYFYLPFLLLLGPLAEIVSYRLAIILGIAGRVGTRLLLIYGTSLAQMQLMQVFYSMGSAAEDVFSAYIYYTLPPSLFQYATSLVKASALLSSLLSGLLGDILVVEFDVPLTTLMIISACSVCCGAVVGLVVIGPSAAARQKGLYAGVTRGEEPLVEPLEESDLVVSALHEGLTNDTTVVTPGSHSLQAPKASTPGAALAGAELLLLQLRRLYRASACSARLRALTAMWVLGNSVYSIIYSYEVTIYIDLQLADGAASASDNWNGSILSVMLLAGALGALLPSLMKVEQLDEGRETNLICFFLLICCLWLLLFAIVWTVWASLACLTLFFFFWQFVNVVYYARLGLAISSQREGGESEPPYSIAVVAVVAASVAVQIVLQGVLFNWLQMQMRDISLVLSLLFCAAALFFLYHAKGEFFASCSD